MKIKSVVMQRVQCKGICTVDLVRSARSRYEAARWGGDRKRGTASVHSMTSSSLQVFYLNTLELTDPEECKLGEGGYGSIYRGTIATGFLLPQMLERGRYLPYVTEKQFEEPEVKLSQERVPVAVKKIRKPENDDEVLEMTREGSNMRVVEGIRNVVTAYGVTYCRKLECVCLVMELVEGQQLDAFLRSGRVSSSEDDPGWWKTKIEIFMELVIGLAICHRNGVFHGDLKGSNILVDKSRVPKLIDFGFSFRERDVDYLKDLIGGSPFWISPELLEDDQQEVMRNPYPSDVYSLGMVLVEMILDGKIPQELSSTFMQDKWFGGSPVTLEVPPGMEDFEQVFAKIFQVVEGCCMADRDERITLEQCLTEVQAAYDELCKIGCGFDREFISDPSGLAIRDDYVAMLATFKEQFPDVPEALFLQPMENMMVDTNGSSLVDLFCKTDYGEGIERILSWNLDRFDFEKEVPRLCRLCVRFGSSNALKSLCTRWNRIVSEDDWLIHEACEANSVEALRVLLWDFRLQGYNTWHDRWRLKPLHKLAYQGKTEMVKIVLDRASRSGRMNYVDDEVAGRTPLYYAVAGDSIDAVFFPLEQGANSLGQDDVTRSSDFLDNLLVTAAEHVSLNVMAVLSEISTALLRKTGAAVPCGEKATQRFFRKHFSSSITYLNLDDEQLLHELKQHLKEAKRRGVDAFVFGCSRDGNAEVFKMIASIKDTPRDFWRHLLGHGSREMVAYALDTLTCNATLDMIHVASKQSNSDVMEFLTKLKRQRRVGQAQKALKAENEETEERTTEVVRRSSSAKEVQQDSKQESEMECKETSLQLARDEVVWYRRMFDYEYWEVLNEWVDRGMERDGDSMQLDEFQRISPGSWKETSRKLLIVAAYFGEVTTAEKLLQRGALTDFEGLDYSDSPLYIAMVWENEEVAEVLLRAGAKATSLCMDAALDTGNGNLVRLLIRFGFDTGMKNSSNQTYMDLIKIMDTNKQEFLERIEHPFFTATYGEFE